jgi:FkbM family methyltransferase
MRSTEFNSGVSLRGSASSAQAYTTPAQAARFKTHLETATRVTRKTLRSALSGLLRPVGFDLIRRYRVPRTTFMGLRRFPINTIVDVGANRGQFAEEALAFFPHAHIISFEPQPSVFEALTRRAATRSGHITPVNVALGDTEGTTRMQVHVDWDYSSSLLATTSLAHKLYPYQREQTTVDVRVTTLDHFFQQSELHLKPEILVKIDAQGYDDRVIRGGQAIFRQARACIVEINLDHLYEQQGSFKEIFELLDGFGYTYVGNLDQTYATDGHVVFIDGVFIRG